MNVRVRLVASPGIMRTISKCTFLDAHAMKHVMRKEELQEVFPPGTGIDFDLSQKTHIALKLEGHLQATFNGAPMLSGEEHFLPLGEASILVLNGKLFQVSTHPSHF